MAHTRYTVIATNKTESIMDVIQWHSKRGDTSENQIKDLKIGFGMERMPCGTFDANSMFFKVGILADNLFVQTFGSPVINEKASGTNGSVDFVSDSQQNCKTWRGSFTKGQQGCPRSFC